MQQEFTHVSTHFNELTLERNDCIGRLEVVDVWAHIQTVEELAPQPPPSHLDLTTLHLYKLEDHLGDNSLSLHTNPFAPPPLLNSNARCIEPRKRAMLWSQFVRLHKQRRTWPRVGRTFSFFLIPLFLVYSSRFYNVLLCSILFSKVWWLNTN